jgi:hypothetical protein
MSIEIRHRDTEGQAARRNQVDNEAQSSAANVGTGARDAMDTETAGKKMDLQTLAQDLYLMGLTLGLTPDEAALLTKEMELPLSRPAKCEKK